MREPHTLPDLPLMLAGIPRPVSELLRVAGVPTRPLPAISLLAAGAGRFVLFDSRQARSAAQAQQAARQSLTPLDWRDFSDDPDRLIHAAADPALRGQGDPVQADAARGFLRQLKQELERAGGVWVRMADYPFPFQSAWCVVIEHRDEELPCFPGLAAATGGRATHVVPSRLRAERLAALADSGAADIGWSIRKEDCESSRRGTASHWRTRLDRFRAAGLTPHGLWIGSAIASIPDARHLAEFGFEYACHLVGEDHQGQGLASNESSAPACVRFAASTLPAPARFVEWVSAHYQSGYPLFLHVDARRDDLADDLRRLQTDAARCTLLWQTTLGEFASWWRRRRQVDLRVWRRDAGYEICCDDAAPGPAVAVELWRGDHVATIPMLQPALHVPDDGLIYLRAHQRHPAGLAAPPDAILELLTPEAVRPRAA